MVCLSTKMTCMDCHTEEEVHGDGNTYPSMQESGVFKVSCSNAGCHQNVLEKPGKGDAASEKVSQQAKKFHKKHLDTVDCSACHVESVLACDTMSCQDCHMPKTTAKVSNRPMWLGTKEGFAKHHLVGANTVMLTLLRDNAAALDVNSSNLDLGINRARDMLQSAATVEIVSASVNNGQLEARVRVENNSGHKAPTSYPSRRMWLHFKVTDSNNNVVFESGPIADDGSIAGVDDAVDQTAFEPHYNVINSAGQVQVYEAIMGDSDGIITYTLLRGAQYLKDNRLTPKGFDKLNVSSDVEVHGLAVDDTDFNLGSDEVTYQYQIDVNKFPGDLNVSVSLNYQTIAHGFLQDLYRDVQLEQVQTFKAMYDAQSLKHEEIANAQTTVVSDGGGTPPPAVEPPPVVEPPAVAQPTVNLTASPSSVARGGSITLSWSSTDASSCEASDNWSGSKATSGSQTITLNGPATFTLSCSGDSGSASDTVSYQARGRRWLDLR